MSVLFDGATLTISPSWAKRDPEKRMVDAVDALVRSKRQLMLYWEPHANKTSQLSQISEMALDDFQRKLCGVFRAVQTYLSSGKISLRLLKSHFSTFESVMMDFIHLKAKVDDSSISKFIHTEDAYGASEIGFSSTLVPVKITHITKERISFFLPTQLSDIEGILQRLINKVNLSIEVQQRNAFEFREVDKLKFTVFASSNRPKPMTLIKSPSFDNLRAPMPRKPISLLTLLLEDFQRGNEPKSGNSLTVQGSQLFTIQEEDNEELECKN